MSNLLSVIVLEANKARRSKMLLISLFAFLFIALVATFFMIILKNPEEAKNLGLVSTKAQLFGGEANWKFFLNIFSQAIAIGGIVIFSFIAAWVFGREYINKTIKDLMAVPTSRTTIVIAKFVLITCWCFTFSMISLLTGVAMGFVIKIPGWSYQLLLDNISMYIVAVLLAIMLSWVVAFIANIGRGYFPALAFLVFAVILAQVATVLGWGEYFPWAIPGLYSNITNPITLSPVSYIIVVLTGLFGAIGTILWWRYADHAY